MILLLSGIPVHRLCESDAEVEYQIDSQPSMGDSGVVVSVTARVQVPQP